LQLRKDFPPVALSWFSRPGSLTGGTGVLVSSLLLFNRLAIIHKEKKGQRDSSLATGVIFRRNLMDYW
jgi:hypothetical protein